MRISSTIFSLPLAATALTLSLVPACFESAPEGLRRTPQGPGATVRFNLAHTPLPDIPLPIDTATWPDPTSRTGLRINASLIAPTEIERDARERFDRLEGWGTFAPITVSFDLPEVAGRPRLPGEAALDLANIESRHGSDDYDFANDTVYLVNLTTGLPAPLDFGAGNFDYTLKRLDKYWANDTRSSERNLLFDTIDESKRGTITHELFSPSDDTDFDGVLDVPNLDDPWACPDADPICDDARSTDYESADCRVKRQLRDRCIADHLLTFYERETDTLILRPVLPLDEMTRYAVVITDRLTDANGDAAKSPFDFIYHAAQESSAARVQEIINDSKWANYFGDISGTGLDHVGFVFSFTTQPTVDDMKKLRDGLYGQGPFDKFEKEFPIELELSRAVGLYAGVSNGVTDPPGWQTSAEAETKDCGPKIDNLFIIRAEDIEETLEQLVIEGFGESDGPATQELLRTFDHVDYLMIGSFKAPFLLEGGPQSADPKASFHLDFDKGKGDATSDTVQFFVMVPKETEEFKQPFNVNIYGHGYTGFFIEHILYAGNLARHGLATVGINAMGHGISLGDEATDLVVQSVLSSACVGPFFDALNQTRARDLDRDNRADSGGDFWSSYLFHTRDGVRQSVLDHIQLVRIMRAFGTNEGRAVCRNADTGWDKPATEPCDVDGNGAPELFGDFDNNGVVDFGGPTAKYGTWGESLGGILSGIHGAIDAYVTAASPGSGGGGLTDIGIRSFQGGVVEAVLLRLWGPLVASVPASERTACSADGAGDDCTQCAGDELSIRWVMPDLNDTGELEISCVKASDIADTTLLAYNLDNDELKCVRVDEGTRFRIGVPASIGDRVMLNFYDGVDGVTDYESCRPTFAEGTEPRFAINQYGKGRYPKDQGNDTATDTCGSKSCGAFQGLFYGEGATLVAPAEGFGQIRQTPALRRFIQLAQTALEPGDPISFAPYYNVKPMTDPFGKEIEPHAILTVNTIGDMNVPLNSGIAFARATGALPFFRPDQLERFPEYANYVTPLALYEALGNKTPNRDLIDQHVIEGVTKLSRHPAGAACATSANAKPLDGTFTTSKGEVRACFPTGCTAETEANAETRVCYERSHCDLDAGICRPNPLGAEKCEEALFDADDFDEGKQLYFEQSSMVPHRLARYTQAATPSSVDERWSPRILGAPYSADGGWTPDAKRRIAGLIDAYVVPEGVHTFVNGNPCESFDAGTYLTNLVARFFQTDGTDVYYLSHPTTHQCLGTDVYSCGYLEP